jgi:hypothetical protein
MTEVVSNSLYHEPLALTAGGSTVKTGLSMIRRAANITRSELWIAQQSPRIKVVRGSGSGETRFEGSSRRGDKADRQNGRKPAM